MYDGIVPFPCLLFQKLGANSFFQDEFYLCENNGTDPSKDVFVRSKAYFSDFYWKGETIMCGCNQNEVELKDCVGIF